MAILSQVIKKSAGVTNYRKSMNRITLYQFNSSDIKITVEAYFNIEDLVIDGYDIGKSVEEHWGDSDYAYHTTVPADEVKKLYPLLTVPEGDKEGLLNAIAKTYNTNSCFSDFNDFLRKNGIKTENA
jgi:hypothetical protein